MLADSIHPHTIFLPLVIRNLRDRLIAVQLLNKVCNFLDCITFPTKDQASSQHKILLLETSEK